MPNIRQREKHTCDGTNPVQMSFPIYIHVSMMFGNKKKLGKLICELVMLSLIEQLVRIRQVSQPLRLNDALGSN